MLESGEAGGGGREEGRNTGKGGEVPPDSKPDEWISFSVD